MAPPSEVRSNNGAIMAQFIELRQHNGAVVAQYNKQRHLADLSLSRNNAGCRHQRRADRWHDEARESIDAALAVSWTAVSSNRELFI
jgi:hypothetical protein